MYYNLISSSKKRLIQELRESFSRHPVYEKIVDHIQDRYVFKERPQFGIIVMGASANKVALASDNFMGYMHSHVMLAQMDPLQQPLEWVREDANLCRGETFPSPPGIYYIEILEAPADAGTDGYFTVDPLYTVTDEPLFRFTSGVETGATLQNLPVAGTVRLWENGRFLLTEGKDYTVDYVSQQVRFLIQFSAHSRVTADYRYAGESRGPIPFGWLTGNTTAIPGVVLAFGKRSRSGDRVAVVVNKDRVVAAEVYGGKSESTFDLLIIARDPTQREEISDLVFMYLWGERKAALEFEGIEILDVAQSGEAEDVYDETANEYFFQANVSVQLRSDWEIHVPVPLTLSSLTTVRSDGGQGSQTKAQPLFFEAAPLLNRRDHYEKL